MTPLLVVGNWKMHRTHSETESLIMEIVSRRGERGDGAGAADVVIVPPFTSIPLASRLLSGSGIALGAQNCHWEEEGAFTGEVSARMLAEGGCTYVILGHSERREYAAESDHQISRKTQAALFWGLTPIVCVGEKRDERDSGRAASVVTAQIERCLEDVTLDAGRRIVIAYEPVWAIGSGEQPAPSEIRSMHKIIRAEVSGIFGEVAGAGLPLLYGGSVTAFNAGGILGIEDVDGVLVGGASLDPDAFVAIAAAAGRGGR